jgi:hypothetical protein
MLLRSTVQSLPGPLSLEKRHSSPLRSRLFLPRRFRTTFLALVILVTIPLIFRINHLSSFNQDNLDLVVLLKDLPKPERNPNPPRFYEWHDREKQLPQHNPDLPYPQGREGHYIRFSNHVWGAFRSLPALATILIGSCKGLGLGNVMQELLLNAHLAYLAKRTYATLPLVIPRVLSTYVTSFLLLG